MSVPAQRGFTLIEMLVALSILALLATMMTGGLSFLARADETRVRRVTTLEGAVGAMGIVRQSIGQAQPLFRGRGEQARLQFEGSDRLLRFAGREPSFVPGPPLMAYQYALIDEGRHVRLELRRAPLRPDVPDLAVADSGVPRVLLHLPAGSRFSYFGPLRATDPSSWSGGWSGRRTLPEAVRLAGGSDPQWQDLVIRLAVDTPAVCAAKAGDAPECRT